MSIGEKIAAARKARKMTQDDLAWKMGVSVQAVSKWENNLNEPDKDRLVKLSEVLGLSLEGLMTDSPVPDLDLGKPTFDPDHMYTYVKAKAQEAKLAQTLIALPLMREKHAAVNQKRDSRYGFDTDYAVHPLTLACHALAMGIRDDDVLAVCLLHDVVEDTGTKLEDLPEGIGERVRKAVALVSYNTYLEGKAAEDPDRKDEIKPVYYGEIGKNPLAALVKCMDRCNNLSSMADGFRKEKMVKYVRQTEEYVMPLLEVVKAVPEWNNAAWLLKYQMMTLLETVKRLLLLNS